MVESFTSNPFTHYCITRRDLPPGLQAANLIHAAGESSPGNLPPETHAVALTCPDEASLRALSAVLTANGVRHRAIIEGDCSCESTPYDGQLMAIGVEPQHRGGVKKFLSSLPLLR